MESSSSSTFAMSVLLLLSVACGSASASPRPRPRWAPRHGASVGLLGRSLGGPRRRQRPSASGVSASSDASSAGAAGASASGAGAAEGAGIDGCLEHVRQAAVHAADGPGEATGPAVEAARDACVDLGCRRQRGQRLRAGRVEDGVAQHAALDGPAAGCPWRSRTAPWRPRRHRRERRRPSSRRRPSAVGPVSVLVDLEVERSGGEADQGVLVDPVVAAGSAHAPAELGQLGDRQASVLGEQDRVGAFEACSRTSSTTATFSARGFSMVLHLLSVAGCGLLDRVGAPGRERRPGRPLTARTSPGTGESTSSGGPRAPFSAGAHRMSAVREFSCFVGILQTRPAEPAKSIGFEVIKDKLFRAVRSRSRRPGSRRSSGVAAHGSSRRRPIRGERSPSPARPVAPMNSGRRSAQARSMTPSVRVTTSNSNTSPERSSSA